tara:strand:- start:195 stop:455 length:261 start_codon:yes stop_codon:yes gene_type:complete
MHVYTTMDTNLIKELIKQTITNSRVEVHDTTGTADHFKVIVISNAFNNLSLVNRHKLIYNALGQYITNEIHALQIVAKTEEENANE